MNNNPTDPECPTRKSEIIGALVLAAIAAWLAWDTWTSPGPYDLFVRIVAAVILLFVVALMLSDAFLNFRMFRRNRSEPRR